MGDQTTTNIGTRIARAMVVVAFFHIFWKFGGFVLRIVLGGYYGLDDVTDAYTIALDGVVFALFLIVEESMGPTFLPVFIYRMKEDGEKRAWQFGSTVFFLLFAALCVTVFAGVLLTPQIVDFVAPGWIEEGRTEARECAVTLMRVGFPGLMGLAMGSLTYVILNAYKIFSYPAAGDSAQKFLMVAVLLGLSLVFGAQPVFIAVGFLAGSVAKIVIHLIGLRDKLSFLRPRLKLRSSDMKKFILLLTPLLVGIVAAKYRDIVTKGTFGSFLPAGQLSAIDWAKRVGDFPTLILPYALSIAMFPFLCEMAKERDYEQFGSVVTRTLKLLALFFVPLTVATIIMRQPIIQFVYQWGKWTDVNTAWTSLALGCYVTALVFYACEMVLMQSFFSMQNTWIPVSVGLVASFLQIAGLYVAVNYFGLNRFYCVALAFPISRVIKNLVLIRLIKRKVPILQAGEITGFAGKLILITAGVGCVMYLTDLAVAPMLAPASDSRIVFRLLVGARLAAASLAGAGTFVALCFALRLQEARLVVSWLRTEGWDRIKARMDRK